MATLHIVSQSPHQGDALASCLRFALAGDTVLLTEDGIFAAVAEDRANTLLAQAAANGIALRVLAEDLEARGLADIALAAGVAAIDRSGFVDLAAELDRAHSWF